MNDCGTSSPRASQRGQTFLAIAVMIAILLLGILGLSTDYVQLWAHRQMAQAAADAACQAGAADLFINGLNPSLGGTNGLQSFSWVGTGFTCAASPNTPPCKYAALNGYSGANVTVSFPTSITGVNPLPSGFGSIANPYIEVHIKDPVPMSFTKLVSNSSTVNVGATAYCGLNPISIPTPLVVLHQTASGSLSVAGAATITIFGGPTRSIQVESTSSTAVSVGTIDLSKAGPSGTGADFGVVGGPTTKPTGVSLGSTGNWIPRATPLGDPWATVATPTKPSTAGTASPVPIGVNGCPDPSGCVEFSAGDYTGCSTGAISPGGNGCLIFPYSGGSRPKFSTPLLPNWSAGATYTAGTLILPTSKNAGSYVFKAQNGGKAAAAGPTWSQTFQTNTTDGAITWVNVGVVTDKPSTGIFDPGLYYLGSNGLVLGDNSTVRPSTATGDGNFGIMFYFSSSATVSVTSNTGKSSACSAPAVGTLPSNCIVSYNISGTTWPQSDPGVTPFVPSRVLQCTGGPANPSQVPTTIDGNILIGPCSGTYGSSDGTNRGFLFFQNRSASATPGWGGGGQFLLSGFIYFHSGNGASCGTSTTCFTMNGGSGAGAFTLGNIVVDELAMTGNSGINMILNPAVTFQVLKPQLLQ